MTNETNSNIEPGAALITGAARRIGKAIALDLARNGWRIAIHFQSSRREANDLVSEIEQRGFVATALSGDLSDPDVCVDLIDRASEAIGPLNCLINNASIFEYDEISSLTAASWDLHLDINLRAPALLVNRFSEKLPIDTRGNIVNIIDQRVWNLTPYFTSYSISKAALWSLTQIAAQALAPRIRVNGIGPGPVLPSPRQSKIDFDRQSDATPLGRASDPQEICDAIRFILNAPGVTGQMIAIDGGAHLSWFTQNNPE